jgi:hypothetical protein
MIKKLSDELYIGGNFQKVVQLHGAWLVVDQTGRVVRTRGSKEEAIEFAKSLYMRSPIVYTHSGDTYVGRVLVLEYELCVGYVISKGPEVLYVIEDEADALKQLEKL